MQTSPIRHPEIKPPSNQTLKKYGLTADSWLALLESQNYGCLVCERLFDEKVRPCVDHFHQKNFKKMTPESKRKWVRGLLCMHCNRVLVPKGMTTKKAKNVYLYLKKFDEKISEISDVVQGK